MFISTPKFLKFFGMCFIKPFCFLNDLFVYLKVGVPDRDITEIFHPLVHSSSGRSGFERARCRKLGASSVSKGLGYLPLLCL